MNSGSGSGSGYDIDVSHYSVSELLDLVGLGGVENIGEVEFSEIIQGFVDKYREIDIALSRFFSDVGLRLYSLFVHDDKVEGLTMRSKRVRGGNNLEGGGEIAEGGGYDDYMGGV